MSGGTIVVKKASSHTIADMIISSTTNTVTGGTLQIGNASTPTGQTIRINSTAPIYNFVVNATNSPTAQLVTNPLTVKNDVTIAGGTLNANNLNMNVGGNWTNNGTFTPGSGTVVFNGAAAQTIGGSTDTTFAFLTINNAAGVSLNRPVRVNNQLALTNGLLTLGSNDLTLGSSASPIIGTFGDTRMVVADGTGALCKQFAGNGSFDYPIGDAVGTLEYSPVTSFGISGANYSNLAVCFRVTDDGHSNKPAAATTYITRYWTGTRQGTIDSLSYGATFSFKSGDVVGAEAMNGKKWDGGPTWTELGAVSGTNFSASGQTSFSDFTAFKSGVLAVTLADFSAVQQGDMVLVTWETASELDNRGFNLYRGTSPAGPDRQLNTTLIPSQSQGNPGGFIYTWEDRADLVPGTAYYYWLETVDISGVTTQHGPVSAVFQTPTAVTLIGLDASAGGKSSATLWIVTGLIALAVVAVMERRVRAS